MSLDNSKQQFTALAPQYQESVRQPFTDLLAELSATFDGTPKVFRPNRDVRFSHDKRPYKTNVSGYLEGADSMLYLDLSTDGLMAATGFYQMAKDQLMKYRAALSATGSDAVADELREIMKQHGANGEGLKTVPRGVAKDHPNADLLRYTSITFSATLPADQVVEADVLEFATKTWNQGMPLNRWLSKHVGPSNEAW